MILVRDIYAFNEVYGLPKEVEIEIHNVGFCFFISYLSVDAVK